jgi:hypothetical protein
MWRANMTIVKINNNERVMTQINLATPIGIHLRTHVSIDAVSMVYIADKANTKAAIVGFMTIRKSPNPSRPSPISNATTLNALMYPVEIQYSRDQLVSPINLVLRDILIVYFFGRMAPMWELPLFSGLIRNV